MSSPFGPFGFEDIPWWDMQGVGGDIGKWAGAPGQTLGKIMGGVVPVLVMNRDTGKIEEKALVEQVYFASIACGAIPPTPPGGGIWIPIWDFESEIPDPLVEQIILKVATGIIDLAASKIAPPAALLARALERSAQATRGGVSSLAVVRGVFTNMANRNLFITASGEKAGTGNADGDRIGWPIQASSSFNQGYGEIAGNARLSMGTNPVDDTLPSQIVWDANGTPVDGVAYGGIFTGLQSGQNEGVLASQTFVESLFPLVITPGQVLHFTVLNAPTLQVPFGTGTWPQNGCVSVWWSEFSV